jgi:integrase
MLCQSVVPIMASVHRQAGKPNWFCSFSIWNPDANRWHRVFRSTKTKNKRQALEIARAWQKAARKAHSGLLNAESARAIIAEGVSDVLLATSAESLPSASIKAWCDSWLQAKSVEISESSLVRYRQVIERFTEYLGDTKSNRDLATLHASDVARFRDAIAKERSSETANLSLSVLRSCFGEAVRQGLLTANPAASVKLLKSSNESRRRAFTLPEIKRILKACDQEWRGLVLFGLYVGQRLGDLARLTWRAVDLEQGEIAFTARKTGRRIVLPLMKPLLDYLESLSTSDDPDAFIFPNAAKHKRTGSLSNQFRDILVDAGLVAPIKHWHANSGKGRKSARETSEISFHSLRHSAVTMLKAAGVSDFMAREIVGHDSAAISRQYTHLTTDDKRRAMAQLPDVSQ